MSRAQDYAAYVWYASDHTVSKMTKSDGMVGSFTEDACYWQYRLSTGTGASARVAIC